LWKHYFHLSSGIQQIYEGRRSNLEDVFHYLFDIEVRKFLLEKENKYLHELFEKWDPEHLQIEEEFNDGLENNVKDEDIQNLNVDE